MQKKTKNLILILVFLNLVFAGGYWYLKKEIGDYIEKTSAVAKELDFEVKKEEKLKSTEHIILDTKDKRRELENFFVSDEEVVDFIKDVESLGGISGVDVEIKSVAVINTEDSLIETLNLQLETAGSWGNSMHFFALVESFPYMVNIERFSIEEVGGDIWTSQITLNILKTKKTEN